MLEWRVDRAVSSALAAGLWEREVSGKSEGARRCQPLDAKKGVSRVVAERELLSAKTPVGRTVLQLSW